MKKQNNSKKPVIYMDRQKVAEFSKMKVSSRLKWLEEANKFVNSLRSLKPVPKS